MTKSKLNKNISSSKFTTLNKGTFSSELGKSILEDMYSYHEPINFNFSKLTKDIINNNTKKKYLFKELGKIKKKLENIQKKIETRNINIWESEKLKVRYYKSSPKYKMIQLKTLVSNKYLYGKEISQAWLKMYEILEKFKLISKKYKKYDSFHMCELPGNFISATNYYIKSKTNVAVML